MKKKIKLQVRSKRCIPKWIPPEKRMNRYDQCAPNSKQKWVDFRIVVPDEETKQQMEAAFEYLHDNPLIDTDFMAVNAVVHGYLTPEREKGVIPCIIVDSVLFNQMKQRTCPHSWGRYFYDGMEFCKECHKCVAVTSYRG